MGFVLDCFFFVLIFELRFPEDQVFSYIVALLTQLQFFFLNKLNVFFFFHSVFSHVQMFTGSLFLLKGFVMNLWKRWRIMVGGPMGKMK